MSKIIIYLSNNKNLGKFNNKIKSFIILKKEINFF